MVITRKLTHNRVLTTGMAKTNFAANTKRRKKYVSNHRTNSSRRRHKSDASSGNETHQQDAREYFRKAGRKRGRPSPPNRSGRHTIDDRVDQICLSDQFGVQAYSDGIRTW